ncbi:PH domain-containing protein [Jeotgalibacillus proteolyticus]|uniref:PH domain-containing protein n=1 Tax=Jeotgalibacillus proteolyticus TaxID=2082395 RepID=UPI003CF0CD17
MYLHITEPSRKISSKIVGIWQMTNTIGHTAVLIILGAFLYFSSVYQWAGWIDTALYILVGLMVISAVFSIFIEPSFLQKSWRYEIDEEFVQLKHGRFNQYHTLIPMEKVEYVTTDQGPFLRRHDLYNVKIGTTTSSHTIPAIYKDEALALRSQIAVFAKVKDTDSEREEEE